VRFCVLCLWFRFFFTLFGGSDAVTGLLDLIILLLGPRTSRPYFISPYQFFSLSRITFFMTIRRLEVQAA
jgi:hypothetical protein